MAVLQDEFNDNDSVASKFTILLVEDDLLALEMMGLLLSDSGYDVIKASCLQEAFAAVEEKEIDLVLSDISLPDGDALELMRVLHGRYGVPGISVSGYAPEEAMREAGFVEHITKPVEFTVLIDMIEKLRSSARFYQDREVHLLPFS